MRALTRSEADVASLLFRHVAEGNGGAAVAEALQLAERAPDSPDALHALALCLAQADRPREADEAFRGALALAPGNPSILSNRARFLRRHGELQAALACWQDRLRREPGDGLAWVEAGLLQLDLASAAVASGRAVRSSSRERRAAIQSLRHGLTLNPGDARGWHALAAALRDEHELEDAESALRRALELQPRSSALWSSLAGVLRLRGRPERAVEAYRRAKELSPQPPEVLDAEVGALIDCLEVDQARAAALQVIENHPEFPSAYTTLANLEWEYGDRSPDAPPAESALRAALDQMPENIDLHMALIAFLLETKRAQEAAERIAWVRSRRDAPTLMALQANAFEILGQSERAAALYAQADRFLGERDANFNNAYVRHLLKSGQSLAAAKRAERTLRLDPCNQETWAYLATAWRLTSDPREDWLCGFERIPALVPVEVPPGWQNMGAFLLDLREALEPLHRARSEPITQSLRGGSQTPGRLFGRDEPRVSALQAALEQTIERWLRTLPVDDAHPFLGRKRRSVMFTGSWSVKLWQSGCHANHFHSEGWMSSAFYVALPPSVAVESTTGDARPGALQLGQPPAELGLGLKPRRVIQPRQGYVALFPSFMWHGTVPFSDTAPRMTVAFDMLPRS